jgi:hypothetical protein
MEISLSLCENTTLIVEGAGRGDVDAKEFLQRKTLATVIS